MVKTAELTGSLPEVLDDQSEYYSEMDKTRKEMVTALTYPAIVLVVAVGVLAFIMIFVVPQFVTIFESMDGAAIPGITKFILTLSDILKNQGFIILIGLVLFCIMQVWLYKNVTIFRGLVQVVSMHIPVIGNVIIYNEVTTFTRTFASLLEHNVFITDSMNILSKITDNEVYKSMIADTVDNLRKGDKISLAFKNHWAFPLPAYEMIVTGERTGELANMMKTVSVYYQGLHRNSVSRIKTFIEPILIIGLTVMTGVIVLSIIIPMFSMYNSLQGL
jgi:type IV pilus assembly protein PilC